MDEREKIVRTIEAWRIATHELEIVRREEIRQADTQRFILETAGLLSAQRDNLMPRRTSGLVQQQALFSSFVE